MRGISVLTAIAAALTASAAAAHDFFLLPGKFTTQTVGTVSIQATVGSSFPTPEIVVPADRSEKLLVFGPGSPRIRIVGAGEKSLNIEVSGARPGLLVAAASSKPRDVDYSEDRITLILDEYRVLPEAAAAVEKLARPRTWQVVSRRYAKTFICVDDCKDRSAAEQATGLPLEFVGGLTSGDHFRLLANGVALANYPLDLVGQDGKRRHLTTDARGEVHLPADARGMMMLFAAKLKPPAGEGRFTLDLTSLTFSRT